MTIPISVSALTVYVISVRDFEERQRELSSKAYRLGLNLEFIWDFDPDEHAEFFKFCCETMPPKSASCVLKHMSAQKRLLDSGAPYALVVEDDVVFHSNFVSGLLSVINQAKKLPKRWLIFLGGADNHWPLPFWKIHDEYEIVKSPITTAEAYLIDHDGAVERLKWLEGNKITLPADHFLASLDPVLGITQYRIATAIAGQASITGKFKTSLDANRAKHGGLYLRLRYLWNRFRKQLIPLFLFRIFKKLKVL